MAMFPSYSGALFGSSNAVDARPAAANTVATTGAGSNVMLTYEVEGMTCTGCETAVYNAINQMTGVKQCRASYENGRARAVASTDAYEAGALLEAIESVGFRAKRVEQ
jgi:copper chaperone CopZ